MTLRRAAWNYGVIGAGGPVAVVYRYGDNLAGRPWVLCAHSYGADASQFLPVGSSSSTHIEQLAQAGLVVIAGDCGGDGFTGAAAHANLDTLYTYGTATLGLAATCALHGRSMGGGLVLDWGRRNTLKVRRILCFAPLSDTDLFHDDPTYTAATDAAFAGNYAVNAVGHKVIDEAAQYAGLPWPIRIYHGDADTVVPLAYSQNFVAAVNDPDVALTVLPGVTHTGVAGAVSATAVVGFLAA